METKELKFIDFEPNELLGKTVLFEYGKSYNLSLNRALRTIEKVTKTGFRISKEPEYIFSFIDGHQKGLNSRQDMGTISRCRLITGEDANKYRSEWATNKKINLNKETIKASLDILTLEQLESIIKIINKED